VHDGTVIVVEMVPKPGFACFLTIKNKGHERHQRVLKLIVDHIQRITECGLADELTTSSNMVIE